MGEAIFVGPLCGAYRSPVPAYFMDELNALVGFPEVWGSEKRKVEGDRAAL